MREPYEADAARIASNSRKLPPAHLMVRQTPFI
jgi:hypothetical protein